MGRFSGASSAACLVLHYKCSYVFSDMSAETGESSITVSRQLSTENSYYRIMKDRVESGRLASSEHKVHLLICLMIMLWSTTGILAGVLSRISVSSADL